MSAWLCGNGTLSLCVDVLKSMDEYVDEEELVLLNRLSDLNTKSLICRYGKREHQILKDRMYISLDVDDGQRYKSVCCYIYQTCECDSNYDEPLFKSLVEWSDENEECFESLSDDYFWDIDNHI